MGQWAILTLANGKKIETDTDIWLDDGDLDGAEVGESGRALAEEAHKEGITITDLQTARVDVFARHALRFGGMFGGTYSHEVMPMGRFISIFNASMPISNGTPSASAAVTSTPVTSAVSTAVASASADVATPPSASVASTGVAPSATPSGSATDAATPNGPVTSIVMEGAENIGDVSQTLMGIPDEKQREEEILKWAVGRALDKYIQDYKDNLNVFQTRKQALLQVIGQLQAYIDDYQKGPIRVSYNMGGTPKMVTIEKKDLVLTFLRALLVACPEDQEDIKQALKGASSSGNNEAEGEESHPPAARQTRGRSGVPPSSGAASSDAKKPNAGSPAHSGSTKTGDSSKGPVKKPVMGRAVL